MAPPQTRQLLAWTLPVAVLISYFWYKRRRIAAAQSDENFIEKSIKDVVEEEEIREKSAPQAIGKQQSPNRNFCRSLSGVESAPIDIILPPKLKASKSNPIVISDEDLDIEIEKIKSMKYGGSVTSMSKNKKDSPSKSSVSPTITIVESKTVLKSPKPQQQQQQKCISVEKSPKMVNNTKSNKKQKQQQQSTADHSKKNKSIEQITQSEDFQRHNNERDSANPSPIDNIDGIMASLSLSSISDNHSEGSNDSGKGGSEVITPPPSRTPGADSSMGSDMTTIHQFIIPQSLVGHLIGKNGSFIHVIQDKTGANIYVKKHPNDNKLKLCLIDGTQKEINSALKLIREKFPIKRFPKITLKHVSFAPEVATFSLVPDHLYLKLVEGINNDTILSCVVSPNHIFLQQPTHPSFPNLNILISYMDMCYADPVTSPRLPTPIPPNTICAAFSVDHWLRAMVISTDEEAGVSYVKFLDQGGYSIVNNENLRQIRGDFLMLPFQAAECILANVQPSAEGWLPGATEFIGDITKGVLIYTQIVDYVDDGIPVVLCYLAVSPSQLIYLNEEIVSQGYGEWVSLEQQVASLRESAATAVVPFSASIQEA